MGNVTDYFYTIFGFNGVSRKVVCFAAVKYFIGKVVWWKKWHLIKLEINLIVCSF